MDYPLYDVPWLVRDPNEYRMSKKRHEIEVRNQAVVDDYFVARANGASAHEALHLCLVLSRSEKKRKILLFGKIFHFGRNTKVGFDLNFAADFEKRSAVFVGTIRGCTGCERDANGVVYYTARRARLSNEVRTSILNHIKKEEMKAELTIPIDSLRGMLRKDGYYFRIYKGQQIVQRCPRKWTDTPARKAARERFIATYGRKKPESP